mmetsp:Transcript_35490/g.39553  ORF Transcript_35490/g.39553 Transcript_35490/m.39553 type:complete len:116 (+) Transcript_35490:245-592(+)
MMVTTGASNLNNIRTRRSKSSPSSSILIWSFVVIIITSIAIVVHGQPQHQLRTTAGASTTAEAVGTHPHGKDEEDGRGGGLLGRRGRNFIRQPVFNDDDDDDDGIVEVEGGGVST